MTRQAGMLRRIADACARASHEYPIGGPICLSERRTEDCGAAALASEEGRLGNLPLGMERGSHSRDTAGAMSEENVEIARKAFAAFERGDMEELLRFVDEDIVITQADVPGIPPQQHGHRGFVEALEVWPEQWDDFRVEILRIAAAPAGKV